MNKAKSDAGKLGYLKSKNTHLEKYNNRIDEYNKHPTKCKDCNESIEYKKRKNSFCSKSCAVTYNNKQRGRKENKCLNCNNIINGNKYCDNVCQQEYQWKLTKKEIELTNIFGEKDQTARRNCKKYLIEKYGNICQICKTKEWLGKPILLMADHIDGDNTNHSINNMRIICSNCDATLPTYKNKNKGNGRKSRKLI